MSQTQGRPASDTEFDFDIVDVWDDGAVSVRNMALVDAQNEVARLQAELLHMSQVRIHQVSHSAIAHTLCQGYSNDERAPRGEGLTDCSSQEKNRPIVRRW